MRQVVVARPFAGGYRSDVPDYALNTNECAYAQDLIYPFGVAQQRWGWAYDGTTADVAANLVGVDRSRYPVPEATRTITTDANGDMWIHNASAAGTQIYDRPSVLSSATWIPRCMYNGEVIFCAQDGVTPLLRYGGSALSWANAQPTGYASPATFSFLNGTSEVSFSGGVSLSADIDKGSFITSDFLAPGGAFAEYPTISTRVLARLSTSRLNIDSLRNATSSSTPSLSGSAERVYTTPVGFAWPGIPVWDSGTMTTHTGNVFTFTGVDLSTVGIIDAPGYIADALLLINPTAGGAYFSSTITQYSTSPSQKITTVSTPSTSFTGGTAYRILRRLPFKDATVHKNSLWGTGVKQYPNRVYVGPPLWNIGLPPGAVEPFDPTENGQFSDLDEFVLLPIDVPSRYDSDPVVAVLPTPGPLLVLKGASVYGIFGTYPSLEQSMITTGAGCVDLRSAISVDGVAYWAGRDGIYSYAFGQIQNLTQGRIEREWQSLMRGYVAGTSYVSAAVVAGHLVISAGGLTSTATGEAKIGPDSANPSERTFVMDIKSGQWTSRLSNARMRNMATVRVPGEVPSIFGVSDDRQGRVIDLTPTVTGTKCTNRASQTLAAADPTDAAGTGPRMQAWSSASLAQASGIEGEARMLDLSIHTNLYDTAVTPTAAIDVSSAHGDALDSPDTTVKAEGTITGDNVDRVDRTKFRVNKTGRLHQVRIDMDTTPATTAKSQIPEMVASFRDNRRMT